MALHTLEAWEIMERGLWNSTWREVLMHWNGREIDGRERAAEWVGERRLPRPEGKGRGNFVRNAPRAQKW